MRTDDRGNGGDATIHGKLRVTVVNVLIGSCAIALLTAQAQSRGDPATIRSELNNTDHVVTKLTDLMAALQTQIRDHGALLAQPDARQGADLRAMNTALNNAVSALTQVTINVEGTRAAIADGANARLGADKAASRETLDDAGRAIAKFTDRMAELRTEIRNTGRKSAQQNARWAAGLRATEGLLAEGPRAVKQLNFHLGRIRLGIAAAARRRARANAQPAIQPPLWVAQAPVVAVAGGGGNQPAQQDDQWRRDLENRVAALEVANSTLQGQVDSLEATVRKAQTDSGAAATSVSVPRPAPLVRVRVRRRRRIRTVWR